MLEEVIERIPRRVEISVGERNIFAEKPPKSDGDSGNILEEVIERIPRRVEISVGERNIFRKSLCKALGIMGTQIRKKRSRTMK